MEQDLAARPAIPVPAHSPKRSWKWPISPGPGPLDNAVIDHDDPLLPEEIAGLRRRQATLIA
jgi:hypothetical protein